jgi:hypothetical protein
MKGVQPNRGYELPLNDLSGRIPLVDRGLNGQTKDNSYYTNGHSNDNSHHTNGREYGLGNGPPRARACPPTALHKSCTGNIHQQTDLLICCPKTTSQHLTLIPNERQNRSSLHSVYSMIGPFQYLISQSLKFQGTIHFRGENNACESIKHRWKVISVNTCAASSFRTPRS